MEIQCVWHYHIFLYLDLVAPKSNDFIATDFFFLLRFNPMVNLVWMSVKLGWFPPPYVFLCACVVSVRGVDKAEVGPNWAP